MASARVNPKSTCWAASPRSRTLRALDNPEPEPAPKKPSCCQDKKTGVCSADIPCAKKSIRCCAWCSASAIVGSAGWIVFCAYFMMFCVPYWVAMGVSNVSTAICYASVISFYISWFFYPVNQTETYGARAKFLYKSWQTKVLFALVALTLVLKSIDWAMYYGYATDGNRDLQASRLGHVGPNNFKIFHHYPGAKSVSTQYKLAEELAYTPVAMSDPIGTIEVRGLSPSTEYHYRVVVDDKPVLTDIPLTTAPLDGHPTKFSFSFGSCLMSNQMYKGVSWPLGRASMMKPFERLSDKGAAFVLMLGDTYYMDVPYFIGPSVSDFEIRARQALGSHPYKKWSAKIPSYYMYDDHEIVDNWDGGDDMKVGKRKTCLEPARCFSTRDIYTNGVDVYDRFFMATNPKSHASPDADGRRVFYFNFAYGDNHFFMLDTRAFRSPIDMADTDPDKTMLGAAQLSALKTWARARTTGFKFILSPSPVVAMTPPHLSDAWVRYPLEREAILDFLEENRIRNVVFLSGDIHIPFAAELRPGVFEFSLSPMAGFGAVVDDFAPETLNMKLDKKLLWYEKRYISVFAYPMSYIAMINVDTTSKKKKFTVEFFSHEDDVTPTYSKTVNYIGR